MKEIIITGIDKRVGPGDIVGAFINEAGISPKDIGKIDINKGKAKVEIKNDKVSKVVQKMNGNKIAGVKVTVQGDKPPEDMTKLEKYVSKYKSLVEMERKEEMERYQKEMNNLSGYVREKKGRAILHLSGRDQGEVLGGKYKVKFVRQKRGEQLPDTEISVGDLAMISKGDPKAKNPTGTVIDKTRYSLDVVFDSQPPKFVYKKGLRLDLYVNDIAYQRMLEAIDNLQNAKGRLKALREKILESKKVKFLPEEDVEYFNKDLNNSQKRAVKSAIFIEDFLLIHGPPGTGKTMTAIEVIQQYIKRGETVLATADSNTAVDNMVERLVDRGVNALRVGHPARVSKLLQEHTLDFKLEENEKYKKAIELRKKAKKMSEKQDDHTFPSGPNRRGLGDSQIKSLAQKGSSSRGVHPKKIQSMAEWLKIQYEVNKMFEKINKLEEEAVEDLIWKADVVCSTNVTAGSDILANDKFDLVLIDEATQSTEPSALIPFIKGDRVVMAGDHKQLPPTVLNQEAKKELSKSIFERLLDLYGDEIKETLTVQYRMNEDIMEFSNREFYDDILEAHEKVKNWTLSDLNLNENIETTGLIKKVIKSESPINYIDTYNLNTNEKSRNGSKSLKNQKEAELVQKLIESFLKMGISPREVSAITPYKDQVHLIERLVENKNVEINSVDGFQGREKEVIIISLVRSNETGNIGFLKDLRRLNVSLTRAKKKLIIIGDSNTLKSEDIYNRLIEYIKDKEGYLKSSE
ncbi:MAG: IGHMBP2 family helicase [Fusobacteriota bacterium]